tara:strand:+ start:1627 stop:1866 length:240 start_codon:yes stop_codon:yes gene_type:complete
MNYDQWKLASPDYTEMVSRCCGAEVVDSIDNENDIETIDDYVCCECQDYCDIIEDYEYKAIRRENYLEMMEDERRIFRK